MQEEQLCSGLHRQALPVGPSAAVRTPVQALGTHVPEPDLNSHCCELVLAEH